MSLFKAKILSQYNQDEQVIEERYALLQNYQKKAEDIKDFKEEQYQTGFLEEIFEQCLGYTLKIHNPKNYNLEREKKNETDSKKADAVIYNSHGEVIAVIELKDQKTNDLSKAVEQAFNYHNSHKTSKYIIVSNFNELRFYIDKKTDCETFNLFTMNKDEFRRFYLILNYQSIVSDLPIEIKQKSDIADADISKKLYADFSQFRLALFDNAKQNNPNISQKKLLRLIQKFCDRIIFILFAEDKGLLKPNTIAEIENKHKQIKGIADISLYQIYQKYFQAIDKGSTDLGIMPYNGGLFSEDKELDALKIDDSVLHNHLPKLSAYDFKSDISVNILGHIFEQSLSDLEELNAAIDNQQFDYNSSKRKKDGIFYTPEYITQFIVEQTLGKICEDKKAELGLNGEIRLPEKIKKKLNQEEQNLLDRLYQYRNFLLELKIIDPACGSGAFLNQALEFLIQEHYFIDKHRRILENESLGLYDIEISILENNLYGVDINADAVEIAKLSLWLRTAQKGRKLTDLSNNIKCGNSLIDDKTVDKNAFIWEQEFSQIMESGGFDIVIGNPPYGVTFTDEEKKYLNSFDELVPDYAIYIYFISLYKRILKNNGLLSYIFPNTFLSTIFGEKYRERLIQSVSIYGITDLSQDKTFEDASVRTCIFSFMNNITDISCLMQKLHNQKYLDNGTLSRTELLNNKSNLLSLFSQGKIEQTVIEKIKNHQILNEYFDVSQGLIPYDKYRGHSEETIKNRIWHADFQKDETYKPELKGGDISRYFMEWNKTLWISYGDWLAAPRSKKFFTNKRILVREITADKLFCTYTEDEYYNTPSIINIIEKNDILELKYILTILNSTLIGYLHNKTSPKANKGLFPKILVNDVRKLPIPKISLENQQPFIELADKMLQLNAEFNHKKQRFIRRLQDNFPNIKIKGGLNAFWTLAFADFVNELKKQKIKLSLTEQDEWEEYFAQYQTHLTALQQQIQQTDNTINQMVYKLYNLTDEEIKIIEQA